MKVSEIPGHIERLRNQRHPMGSIVLGDEMAIVVEMIACLAEAAQALAEDVRALSKEVRS